MRQYDFDRWHYVIAASQDEARSFFAVPSNWPAEYFERDPEGRGVVWRVLSESWLREKACRRSTLLGGRGLPK